MPDLVIKPTATSGNKLILKDQAGGAVLTTADSGATLGNSTQDNITRLGTVTVGNLSNAAIVYPDGHVIQTIFNTSNTTANGQGTTGVLAVSNTITMASASHKLLVMAVISMRLTSAASMSNAAGGTELKTSGSGVTAQTFHPSVTDASGLSYGININLYGGFGSGNAGLFQKVPINYLFSPAYAGTVTVTANGLGYSTNEGVCYTNVGGGGQSATSSLLLMEVVA